MRFVPDNYTGRLFVVAPKDQLVEVMTMIQQLDRPPSQGKVPKLSPK